MQRSRSGQFLWMRQVGSESRHHLIGCVKPVILSDTLREVQTIPMKKGIPVAVALGKLPGTSCADYFDS